VNETSLKTAVAEVNAVDIATFTSAIVSASRQFGDTRPWWRGQRNVDWTLSAGLYRKGIERKEINLNARFRLMAKARRGDCPSSSDPLGWLFLMQHYRLPTRLLDWSQSPLVALFFALEEPDDTDAAVWALSPTRLNLVEAATESICMPGSATLGHLGTQAFRPGSDSRDERILSVLTEEADVRHMVQQSAFTIHGRLEPLEMRSDCEQFLMRIRIPFAFKRGLRQVLALYGINKSSLFPDLENLASELSQLDFSDASHIPELSVGPEAAS
jgi:FRG domain